MTNGKQILIVDDDGEFLETLCEQLQLHEEFKSVTCTSGAEALKTAKEDRFDVIILDVGLPDMDGREVCRLMRRNGVTSPIIMLTGADTDADTILGLDAGANDYVTKPFRLGVLLARLRAHIRQRLTDKETAILKYLYRAGDKVVGRDILLGEVWGYNAGVTTHTLETHVYRLRQKIESDPSNARLLVTEPGGYRLVP